MPDRVGQRAAPDALRELSAGLFGRAVRLPVAVWVRGRTEPFYQRQAAEGVNDHQTYVRKELAALVDLGMVRELPRETDRARVFYEQIPDHPWWQVIDTAAQAASAPASDDGTSQRPR